MNSNGFTKEELDVLSVTSDLLRKGEVETRIAKYMHDKKWDYRRARRFLDKLKLNPKWDVRIWEAFIQYQNVKVDEAQQLGLQLKLDFL